MTVKKTLFIEALQVLYWKKNLESKGKSNPIPLMEAHSKDFKLSYLVTKTANSIHS